MRHSLGYQIHDVTTPHHRPRHGRADIGWPAATAVTSAIVPEEYR